MFNRCSVVAIITARGGSKGIPRKNLYPINGKPLILYTVDAALGAGSIDQVVVSSDDPAILEVSRKGGAEPLLRPDSLALDHTPTSAVIEHAIEQLGLKHTTYIVLLQPTSPLRTAEDIESAFHSLTDSQANALISVFIPEHHPMKAYCLDANGCLTGLWDKESPYRPRQELPEAYMPNGAIYIFTVSDFIKTGKISTTKAIPFVMSAIKSIDIDRVEDITKVEAVMGSSNEV